MKIDKNDRCCSTSARRAPDDEGLPRSMTQPHGGNGNGKGNGNGNGSGRHQLVSSELSGFYRLPMAQRRALVAELADLSEEDTRVISGEACLCGEQADNMVENALGVMGLPLALCVNLTINGRDWLVPMAVEEASVVAAASHAAKLLRAGGGIETVVSPPHMIGQIQVLDVPDPAAAERAVIAAREELIASANTLDACLRSFGGGAVDVELRHLPPGGPDDPCGPMLIVHLIVDVRDAMGANTVNSMCEHLAPRIAELTGGRVRLRIISNLADRRTVRVRGRVPFAALEGRGCTSAAELARGIEEASVFAERDPYRAATHNKGIMNGVDAVVMAFGQDWRAVEAGAHSFAARGGRYTALARWRVRGGEGDDGALEGEMELPMTVGVVGGITSVHPTVQTCRRLSGVGSAADLASIAAAVGLAQNLGALRALAAEGIQEGHMRVHARNLAVAAGAVDSEVKQIARMIADRGAITIAAAREALVEVRAASVVQSDAARIRARFKQLRERHLQAIMALMEGVVREAHLDGTSLAKMCNYHLDTGGKRLRALLPLLVAEALGVEPARLVPFGAACEMLHNATLVHDDVQDEDRMRRGRATVWHRFGVPQAINLGDAMFYLTLLLVHRLDSPLGRRDAVARQVLRETLRVIEGQERELHLKRVARPSLDEYFAMVEAKTSGLFALPMTGAAALCGQPRAIVEGLTEAARHMGVLFQIQDDLLDLYGDKGRETRGADIAEGKRSILVVHALQTASASDARRLTEILDKDREATGADDVGEALAIFERTDALGRALREIASRRDHAIHVAALAEQPQLQSVVEGMCDLFLEPIQPVIAATTGGGGNGSRRRTRAHAADATT
jgi:hydroxymethylglutaryl-CoA reductase